MRIFGRLNWMRPFIPWLSEKITVPTDKLATQTIKLSIKDKERLEIKLLLTS